MKSYDLFGRIAVLRERAKESSTSEAVRLEQEVLRLADMAEFELGFETLLHRDLGTVRSKVTTHQPLVALDYLEAAIQQFLSTHEMQSLMS
ncbi:MULTISPECIES: hypothetical protein [unclassified Caballeronia]|uniref:hypothetical protein n=1 Tax=unclassified Caballeronia TaxID=2646786 RepID=UPI0020296CE3|nr:MULTISPECIES: hypothetical protein [unclassified Caballeronia]